MLVPITVSARILFENPQHRDKKRFYLSSILININENLYSRIQSEDVIIDRMIIIVDLIIYY